MDLVSHPARAEVLGKFCIYLCVYVCVYGFLF